MAPLLLSAAVVHRPLHLHLAPLLLLVIMLLIHPYIYMAVAQTTSRNLTAGGDTLTPPSYITSPSGDFAFGFHPLGSGGGFLLAIWFLFDGTVVWFATDAGSGSALVATAGQSVLSVSATGQLSLFNNLGGNNNPTPLWNPTRNSGSSLMLQDDGNLRFIGTDGTSVVWESFRNPTDTLLPGQSMLPDTKLQSRSGDMGLSPGYFSFNVQLDGNLVMYNMDTVQGGSGGAVNAYWSTDTCCAKNTTLFFDIDKVGYLYYVLTTGERRNLTDPVSLPTTSGFYQHATLDQDGLFRVYFHPKRSSGSGNDAASWSVMNQVIPKDGCKALTNGRRGMCGPNSYCITRTDDNRIDCECPSGYVFLDPEIRYKGCTPAFLPDSCDGKKHAAEFDLEDVLNTEWAQLTYKTHTGISSEEQCRGLCLNSCSCAAATFDGNNCSEVVMLLAGWQDNSTTLRTMIKVRTKSPPVQILPYVLVAVLGVLFLTSTCILLVHCYISNKKARRSYLTLSPSVRAFSWKELYHATNGFEKLLGKGSFGEVYKGTMRSPHPHPIAVKKLIDSNEYSEQEFTNEVNSIGQIHHRNLVRMIGYCKEGKHRMLVFEFMPGGSLRSFLFNPEKRPPWRWRAEAALAIARGLEYLHDGCSAPIIHCDIKPDNILLDSHGVPRITDFGISKLLGTHQVHTTVTHVRGTRGYIAPEWLRGDARVDTKADVYSFGVVLLEMICCRKCQEPVAPDMPQGTEDDDETVTLFGWAAQLVSARRAELMLDGEADVDGAVEETGRVERFARVALWCMEPNPLLRPTMHQVVQMLESRDEDRVEGLPPDPPSCYMESLPLIPQLKIE